MTISISLHDLLLVSEFSGMTEEVLVRPEMDGKILDVLDYIGFDIDKPVEYIENYHRTLGGKLHIGWRLVGEVSTQERHKHREYFSLEDRLAAAEVKDISLAREMANMGLKTQNIYESNVPYSDDMGLDEEEKTEIEDYIELLRDFRINTRGDKVYLSRDDYVSK